MSKNIQKYKIIQFNHFFSGQRWCRKGGTRVILLDVLNVEYSKGVQRSMLWWWSGHANHYNCLQLILSMGPTLSNLPGCTFLPSKNVLDHDWGRFDEVLWKRNNNKIHRRSGGEKGSIGLIFYQEYSEQVQHLFLRLCNLWDAQFICGSSYVSSHTQIPAFQIPFLWIQCKFFFIFFCGCLKLMLIHILVLF